MRCEKRVPNEPIPPSVPLDTARNHPRFAHRLTPGAQCELPAEHDGPHSCTHIVWHDPPALFVGGERVW